MLGTEKIDTRSGRVEQAECTPRIGLSACGMKTKLTSGHRALDGEPGRCCFVAAHEQRAVHTEEARLDRSPLSLEQSGRYAEARVRTGVPEEHAVHAQSTGHVRPLALLVAGLQGAAVQHAELTPGLALGTPRLLLLLAFLCVGLLPDALVAHPVGGAFRSAAPVNQRLVQVSQIAACKGRNK